jgi:hypothetical protein
MSDRDKFAAAALTGLLAGDPHYGDSLRDQFAGLAFRLADAMLAARGLTTDHDAAPGDGDWKGPGRGYRYLVPGETTECGDEFWVYRPEHWSCVRVVGRVVEPGKGRSYRRRITTADDAAPAAVPADPAAGKAHEARAPSVTGDTRASDSAIVEAAAEVVYRAIMYDRGILYGWLASKSFGAVYEVSLFDVDGSMAQHSARDAAQKIRAMAPPAPGVTLTDAEREVIRRLGPSDHAHACYMVKISPEERRTVAGLLARAGKEEGR